MSRSIDLNEHPLDVIPGGTQTMGKRPNSHSYGACPIYAARGKGARDWDIDGNETGFRLALGGAQERYGVVPDIATLAKGMATGMALAAVVGRKDVMGAAERCRISVTFGGEALSLAAGLATLRICRDRDVAGHLNRVGLHLKSGINAAATAADVAFEAYGPPTLFSGRFLDARGSEESGLLWGFLLAGLARRGIMLKATCNNVTFSHTESEIRETLAAVEDTFWELRRARGAGQLAGDVMAMTGRRRADSARQVRLSGSIHRAPERNVGR